jgi:hypothetical protein
MGHQTRHPPPHQATCSNGLITMPISNSGKCPSCGPGPALPPNDPLCPVWVLNLVARALRTHLGRPLRRLRAAVPTRRSFGLHRHAAGTTPRPDQRPNPYQSMLKSSPTPHGFPSLRHPSSNHAKTLDSSHRRHLQSRCRDLGRAQAFQPQSRSLRTDKISTPRPAVGTVTSPPHVVTAS